MTSESKRKRDNPTSLDEDIFGKSSDATLNVFVNPSVEGARAPTKKSTGAAGYDLYAPCDFSIPAFSRENVDLGIHVAIPPGNYGRIAPRSSLAREFGIAVFAGVVDSDYRGAVSVILFNASSKAVHFDKGDRIAQLIIEKCADFVVCECSNLEDLGETERGKGGFGSTGR